MEGKRGGMRVLPRGRRTRATVQAAAASAARGAWARSCAGEKKWVRYIRPRLCKKAAGRGNLKVLKWLRAKGFR